MTTGTPPAATVIEPNSYYERPMVLNGVYIGMLGLREDQIDYFDIPDPTSAEMTLVNYRGKISAHKRQIYSQRLDDTTATRTINIEVKNNIARNRKKQVTSRGGKPIILPTELTSTPQTASAVPGAPPRRPAIRKTTIRMPQAASNAEISAWLDTKLRRHKPTYFITPSGAHYPILTPAVTSPGGGDTPSP